MKYDQGTLNQYKQAHLQRQLDDGWTSEEIINGKISVNINGAHQPNVVRTMKVFDCIKHPTNEDDYIWPGTTYSLIQVQIFGFLNEVDDLDEG